MMTMLIAIVFVFRSQQVPQAGQAAAKQQQNKTNSTTDASREPQEPALPAKVTIEGPIAIVNEPDPKQEQREAEQRAQTRFANSLQVWTLIFAGLAALGAIGAYFANRRSANAAEDQIALLKGQVEDSKADAVEQRRIEIAALSETRKSADAARDSADTSREGLYSVQRAFLTFGGLSTEGAVIRNADGNDEHFMLAKVFWVNGGSTPATSVIQSFNVSDEFSAPPDGEDFIGPLQELPTVYVAPQGRIESGEIWKPANFFLGDGAINASPTQPATFALRNKRVFFWGPSGISVGRDRVLRSESKSRS